MPSDADLQAMQQIVSASLQKVIGDLSKLQDKAKDTASPSGGFGQLNTLFAGMTRNLAGPVGLAAGIYAVATSLNTFAVGRLQVQNFATDVGASVRMVDAMSQSMRKAGISAQESQPSILKLGSAVKDLAARGTGSALDQLLRDTRVSAEERKKLIEEARTDFDTAMQHTIEILNRGNQELQSFRAQQLGLSQSHVQAMRNSSQELDKVFHSDYKAAKWWTERWVEVETAITNTWERIGQSGLKLAERVGGDKGLEALTKRMESKKEGLAPDSKSIFGRLLDDPSKFLSQLYGGATNLSADQLKSLFGAASSVGAVANPLSLMTNPAGTALGILSKSSISSPAHAATEPSSRELMEVERDSNKLLRDIRDSLVQPEEGGGGQDNTGRTYGRGIRRPSTGPGDPGGAAKAGLGGFRPARSGGGSAGITAPAGTPIQRDDTAEVSTPDGKKFKVASEFKDNFQGFINDYYAAGGTFGPDSGTLGHRPSNASGHPIGAAMDVNQIGYGIRSRRGNTLPTDVEDQIAEKWGFVSGNQWKRPDTGHFGIRSSDAAREALIRNGMLPSEADKAVGKVKGSWFNDRSTASGMDASKVAGIATPGRAGLGEMHDITLPDGRTISLPKIDVGPAKWTGRGVDFSQPALKQLGIDPTDKEFMVRRRETLDRAASGAASGVNANMSASIDFKNMPSWVKSSVDTNGKFKDLRVTRQTPQDGRAGVAWGDTNKWSYE